MAYRLASVMPRIKKCRYLGNGHRWYGNATVILVTPSVISGTLPLSWERNATTPPETAPRASCGLIGRSLVHGWRVTVIAAGHVAPAPAGVVPQITDIYRFGDRNDRLIGVPRITAVSTKFSQSGPVQLSSGVPEITAQAVVICLCVFKITVGWRQQAPLMRSRNDGAARQKALQPAFLK